MKTMNQVIFESLLATIYVVLIIVFQFFSFGEIQFRIAEALLIFVFFSPRHAIGILIGTFLANLFFSPFGILDAALGTLATALAILLMLLFKKRKWIALIFPAITNAVIISLMLFYLNQLSGTPLYLVSISIFLGECAVLYAIGLPLYFYLTKNESFMQFYNEKVS
ncbi:MAG: QueT transporter family protein [Acholeplasmataceae bacterium]